MRLLKFTRQAKAVSRELRIVARSTFSRNDA